MNDQMSTETGNQAPATPEAESAQELPGVELDAGTEDDSEQPNDQKQGTEPQINQEAVDKRINKLTFERHEEQRKRELIQADYEKAQAEIERLKGSAEESVVIPKMPDPFEDGYEARIAEREAAIRKRGEIDARKAYVLQDRERLMKIEAEEAQAKVNKSVDNMYKKGLEYGIDRTELTTHENRVAGFIRDASLASYIISHDRSPLIIKQLSSDAEALASIGTMDAASAAAYIATNVVPKTDSLIPKAPGAPAPVEIPRGKAPGELKDSRLDGVQFE